MVVRTSRQSLGTRRNSSRGALTCSVLSGQEVLCQSRRFTSGAIPASYRRRSPKTQLSEKSSASIRLSLRSHISKKRGTALKRAAGLLRSASGSLVLSANKTRGSRKCEPMPNGRSASSVMRRVVTGCQARPTSSASTPSAGAFCHRHILRTGAAGFEVASFTLPLSAPFSVRRNKRQISLVPRTAIHACGSRTWAMIN